MNKKISLKSSRLAGFYKEDIHTRREIIKNLCDLSENEVEALRNIGYLPEAELDTYIENTIGKMELPFSLATNFRVNGRDYLVPMVTEEPSVVAAASHGAKIARQLGGFHSAEVTPLMIGQIQIVGLNSEEEYRIVDQFINAHKDQLIEQLNALDPILLAVGGGVQDLTLRKIEINPQIMAIVHVIVDVRDAMGANAVNTMAEALGNLLAGKIPGKINLKIISNLAEHRLAKSWAEFDCAMLGGPEIVKNIYEAFLFAKVDPYRACTHNKGIMNGIDSVALATCNDFRAIEAGAHAFASRDGTYGPLTSYNINDRGNLIGAIEIPLPMATVGGIVNRHPMAKIAQKIMGVRSAEELSQVTAAVGLAQNLAALRALADEGIQEGHMKLHLRKSQNSGLPR